MAKAKNKNEVVSKAKKVIEEAKGKRGLLNEKLPEPPKDENLNKEVTGCGNVVNINIYLKKKGSASGQGAGPGDNTTGREGDNKPDPTEGNPGDTSTGSQEDGDANPGNGSTGKQGDDNCNKKININIYF